MYLRDRAGYVIGFRFIDGRLQDSKRLHLVRTISGYKTCRPGCIFSGLRTPNCQPHPGSIKQIYVLPGLKFSTGKLRFHAWVLHQLKPRRPLSAKWRFNEADNTDSLGCHILEHANALINFLKPLTIGLLSLLIKQNNKLNGY